MSRRDPKPLPKPETLRTLLSLDPATGELRWKARSCRCFPSVAACNKWNGNFPGKVAGHLNRRLGRRTISIFDRAYYASRVIYTMVTGNDPGKNDVDHRNQTKHDDRPGNLRAATRSQNEFNRPAQRNNTTGFKGVTVEPDQPLRPYVAQITVRGRHMHLGSYATPEEAHAAYLVAASEVAGEFASGGGVAS